MFTLTRRTVAFAAVLVLLGLAAACGGGAEEQGGGDNRIVVWTGDTIPDRVAKTKDIIAAFTQSTGIQVELVGVEVRASWPYLSLLRRSSSAWAC